MIKSPAGNSKPKPNTPRYKIQGLCPPFLLYTRNVESAVLAPHAAFKVLKYGILTESKKLTNSFNSVK